MIDKIEPQKNTLSKKEIMKLSKKQFFKNFNNGKISIEDFMDFAYPPVFNQVEVAKNALEIHEKNKIK